MLQTRIRTLLLRREAGLLAMDQHTDQDRRVLDCFDRVWLSGSRNETRLSPFGHEHINMLGRYSFAVPDAVTSGELRPLRAATEA